MVETYPDDSPAEFVDDVEEANAVREQRHRLALQAVRQLLVPPGHLQAPRQLPWAQFTCAQDASHANVMKEPSETNVIVHT